MMHVAPSWDSVVVMARPSPVPPPVMKATRLVKLPVGSIGPSAGGKNRAWGGGPVWGRTPELWIHDWKKPEEHRRSEIHLNSRLSVSR